MSTNAKNEALKLINEAKSRRGKSANITKSGDSAAVAPASTSLSKQSFMAKQLSTPATEKAATPDNKWIKKKDVPAEITAETATSSNLQSGDELDDEDGLVQPSILLHNTEDDKRRFFENLKSIHPVEVGHDTYKELMRDLSSSEDDENPSFLVSTTNKSEWLKILEQNNNEIKEMERLALDDSTHESLQNTSDLLASSRDETSTASVARKINDHSSQLRRNEDVSASALSESISASAALHQQKQQNQKRVTAAPSADEGEYSMSFESITDLKNQQFPKAAAIFDTETVSNFEKKEMATFDDSISSISMDERPMESSFVKNEVASGQAVAPSAPSVAYSTLSDQDPKENEVKSLPPAQLTNQVASAIQDVEPIGLKDSRKPVIFQESQLHDIQKNEATMNQGPIVVQGTQQVEQTFLTFAQLLAMNEEAESKNDKAASKPSKAASSNTGGPKQAIRPEKNVKKAILQKANAKVKAPAAAFSKPDLSLTKTAQAPSAAKSIAPVKKSSLQASPRKSPEASLKSKLPVATTTSATTSPVKKPVIQDFVAPKTESHSQKSVQEQVSRANIAEDDRLFDLTKQNSNLLKRVAELEEKSQKLLGQVDEQMLVVQEKHVDIASLQQQNQFLESLLEEKASAANSAAAATDYHVNDPELQKKLDDQEYLIRGYQTENEKLVVQIKELKNATKDLEHRQFLKLEAAQRETATVKTQLELAEASLRKASSISNTQATLTIEELKSTLSKLERQAETQKEDTRQQISKYEALLADANKRVEEAVSSHPEHIKKLVADVEEKRSVREKYIIELETKLEWHIGNQDIFNQVQQRIDRYEKTIEQLNKALEAQLTTNNKSGSGGRSANDIKRIKLLESQIADLQEQIIHNDKPLPDLGMDNPRPMIANEQVVVYLKKIIHDMEQDYSRATMNYEEEIKQLHLKMEKTERITATSQQTLPKEKEAANQVNSKAVVGGFEVVSVSNAAPPTSGVSDKVAEHGGRESDARIAELEAELDRVKQEASEVIRQLRKREQMHSLTEAQLLDLQEKYELEKKNRSQNQNNHSALEAAKAQLEISLSKNTELVMKLELAEKSHQSLHESTLNLMKSSQEQASRIAFEHSKHSLDILRAELRKEQASQNAALVDSFKKRIYDLELRLAAAQDPESDTIIEELEKKIADLKGDYQNLSTKHAGCEERLKRAREGVPPSLAELDRLINRIHELEASAKNREAILKSNLEQQTSQIAKENEALTRKVKIKEAQIKKFEREMELIVSSIHVAKNLQ